MRRFCGTDSGGLCGKSTHCHIRREMALYAANNISSAVRNFEDRSYARIFGIVLNHQECGEMKQKK